jgi:hypothetical protein
MAKKKAPNRIPSDDQLAKATRRKNIWMEERPQTRRRPDRQEAGQGWHWRRAKVPDYANDQLQAYAIDERTKILGRLERYNKEFPTLRGRKIFHRNGQHLSSQAGRALKVWESSGTAADSVLKSSAGAKRQND